MKPFSWIMLLLGGALASILLLAGIATFSTSQSIYSADSQTYLALIDSTLAGQNSSFAEDNLTIASTQYVEDSIAVVRAITKSGTAFTFTFEFYNDTLFLTNYTTGEFSERDFNDPTIAPLVINAAVQN